MFSVFNDAINSTVYMADHEGTITTYPYSSGSVSIQDSLEALKLVKIWTQLLQQMEAMTL